jgi:signal transduction histidine kinase
VLGRNRVLLLSLVGILVSVFLMYTHDLVRRLQESVHRSSETIAWFWAGTQIPFSIILENRRLAVCTECGGTKQCNALLDSFRSLCPTCGEVTRWLVVDRWSDEERTRILEHTRALNRNLVGRIGYPTVLTDNEMHPQVVNGAPTEEPMAEEDLIAARALIAKLDGINDPIPMIGISGDTLGWLHYGQGPLADELRIVPLVELGMLFVLAGVMMIGIRSEIRRDREMAWVGFAKETAHQLSTPLSSLLGWVEILDQAGTRDGSPEIEEAVASMRQDLNRLTRIVQRYGEMGKRPRLVPSDINAVVAEAVDYFRKRPGLIPGSVSFQTQLEACRPVRLNVVLMGWVMENLFKNSLASLSDRRDGLITISTHDTPEKGGMVEVLVSDNGRGISFLDQGRIFRAGFTTRRGGWGLGLALSRRIVEEYHDGRIRLVASSPGKGSCFSILLPAAGMEDDASENDDPVG